MGKSLFISRRAEELQKLKIENSDKTKACITIPLHGPTVTADTVMRYLVEHVGNSDCAIIHFDISPSVMFTW